jgi:hypothetical protein
MSLQDLYITLGSGLEDYLALTILGVPVCFMGSAAIPWLGSKLGVLGWSSIVWVVTWLAVVFAVWTLWSEVPSIVHETLLRYGGATGTVSSVRVVSAHLGLR